MIAITGTPGTGKSTLARRLDVECISMEELADKYDSLEIDGDNHIIDTEKLCDLVRDFSKPDLIVYGHLAHWISPMDKVIVLRCNPEVLEARLKARGYGVEKIKENLEAEVIDLIVIEAISVHGRDKVFEIDNTCDLDETLKIFSKVLNNEFHSNVGRTDWSEEVLKWY